MMNEMMHFEVQAETVEGGVIMFEVNAGSEAEVREAVMGVESVQEITCVVRSWLH